MINNKALQDVQSSIGWESIEELLEEYIKDLRNQDPITTDQFKMTWDIASRKGGEEHLRAFFQLLDNKARYDTR